ncbi:KTSC domain-containing protein, partial [Listeria monocytogenes]|nr:KTSC domain-containing protein [Listeria monocytogenes]MCE8386040.1 KTSC domain-containing protein [Listeria monocytogenes]
MQRNHVSSSRIRSVGWENDILEIEFNDGSIY